VGLDPDGVRLLGALTPLHVPASGFVLHPVVGAADRRPDLRPADGEVARILEVRLADLADPANLGVESWPRPTGERWVPYFALCGEKVWGATAMVLSEFLSAIGSQPDPWAGRPQP
jgi:hypothetical protein